MFYSIINCAKENTRDILIKSICSFMRTVSIQDCANESGCHKDSDMVQPFPASVPYDANERN